DRVVRACRMSNMGFRLDNAAREAALTRWALPKCLHVPIAAVDVRITPNSRGCNSSSSFSEQWGVNLHATPEQMSANRRRGAFIHYADLVALMVMLDMNPGGGVMDAVNEAQKL